MRSFANFILRHPLAAVLIAGLFGILALKIPPFALISAAAVGLYALRQGGLPGVLVMLGAGLVVAGGWFWLGSRPGLDFPLVFALWPPLLLAAGTLRRTESQGAALLVVGLWVGLFILAMHLATGDVVAFWKAWLHRAVAAVPGATVKGFEENDTLRIMNGLLAVLYGLSLMLGLLFARWLQSLMYNPGGFGPEFRRLRLPRLALLVTVALIWLSGYFSPVLLADLFMAAMMLYFFVGLAVIHGVIEVRGMNRGWALPVYIVLVYWPQFALSGLALVGAIDAFVDFRAQQPAPPPT
ncbi:hypothetical protein SAMN02949497_1072 [Methylomagnum ishizawai]|uniref:DUF2232 domain-containing protein n=1 Tax=Methylomagnum ishizawai TaxID=1760988 RepID=A0A1Y6CUB3_9GAMM|nr:hypothetical protein [Methylomagnum ishizawai]SMF93780.1 hypothetical protein SAMN02949497_1072 [Methylomagnum ishizawai]